jgi:PadR family transcriptional regulator, regulatory protein PadR
MMPGTVTEQALFILASLAQGELHGYGIARDVGELSNGQIKLTAGTLYGALGRLTEDGLIAQTREEVVDGRRRRYYGLTGAGRTVFAEEAARLQAKAAALTSRSAIRTGRKPRPA